MRIVEFIIKASFVTLCAGILLHNFVPKYEYVDSNHKFNKITGKLSYFSWLD